MAGDWTRIHDGTRLQCEARTHADLGGAPIDTFEALELVAVLEARAGDLERWQLVGADEPLRVEIGPARLAVAVGAAWHTVAEGTVPASPGVETPGLIADDGSGQPTCIEATLTEQRAVPEADLGAVGAIAAHWSGSTEHTWQWCEGRGLVAWRRVDGFGQHGRRDRSITCGFGVP